MNTWKKIAIIVGVVIIVGVIVVWGSGNWKNGLVNPALCAIQTNIGLEHHFHLQGNDAEGAFNCPHN